MTRIEPTKSLVAISWLFVASLFAIALPASASPPSASVEPAAEGGSGAWTEEPDTGYPALPRWMADLPDSARLSELSIPGTHDSGAYDLVNKSLNTWARTQSMDITTQLMSGIRSLDLRLMKRWGRCYLAHGRARTHVTCKSALEQVRAFLRDYGSETVLVSLQNNTVDPLEPAEIEALLAPFGDRVWVPGSTDMTLKHTRGQMILVAVNLEPLPKLASNKSDIAISEYLWEVPQSALPALWVHKRNFIDAVQADSQHNPESIYWTTITAASWNVTPFYAATGRHRLWTTLSSDCEPEVCEFSGLNESAMRYLQGVGRRRVGVVVADFPGGGLIRAIIDANEFTAPRSPSL